MLFSAAIELIIIAILICGGIFGYRRGLLRLALVPLRLVICLAFAFFFCKSVGDRLIIPAVYPAVANYLKELLSEHIQSDSFDNLPTLIKIFVGLCAFGGDESFEWTLDGIMETVTMPVSTFVSRVIAFVILLILSGLILNLAVSLADRLLDRGFVGRINAILGVLLSGCISAVSAWCFVSVVDYFLLLDIFSVGEFSGGALFRFFREVSPIRLLLGF